MQSYAMAVMNGDQAEKPVREKGGSAMVPEHMLTLLKHKRALHGRAFKRRYTTLEDRCVT